MAKKARKKSRKQPSAFEEFLGNIIGIAVVISIAYYMLSQYKALQIAAIAALSLYALHQIIKAFFAATPSIINVENELLRIDSMDGHDFEYWCADLLKYGGFSDISVTQGSNDQGVDILAYRDGESYAIQCKRYSHKLGNTPVQEVATGRVIYNCDVGIVMTNNYFTTGAVEAANATNVALWDRDDIEELLHAKNQKLREQSAAYKCEQRRIKKAEKQRATEAKQKTKAEAHELIDEIELYEAATDDD